MNRKSHHTRLLFAAITIIITVIGIAAECRAREHAPPNDVAYRAPQPLSPAGGAISAGERPVFTWSPVMPAPPEEPRYRIVVIMMKPGSDSLTAFQVKGSILDRSITGQTRLEWPEQLALPEPGMRYIWSVMATAANGAPYGPGDGWGTPAIFSVQREGAATTISERQLLNNARERGILSTEEFENILERLLHPVIPDSVSMRSFYKGLRKSLVAPCVSGEFEDGTFNGWAGATALNSAGTLTSIVPGLVTTANPATSRHTIMPIPWAAGGYDPIVGGTILPVVPPNGGLHSVRLGNHSIGAQGEILTRTFMVTPLLATLYYRYAIVLQDHGVNNQHQPFFMARVIDMSSGNTIYMNKRVANPNDPFFTAKPWSGGQILYRRWSCASIDLSAYIDRMVTVEFSTADCAGSAHFGYAYIDGICDADFNQAVFTLNESHCGIDGVMANGTATEGESDYFWSVEESDQWYGRPNPSSEVMEWFHGEAGPIDLSAWVAAKGKNFTCGKYYRVKLAIRTECTNWTETVKLIHILCPPPANAGRDTCICCCGKIQLGAAPVPGLSYSWSPSIGLNSTTIANPIFDACAFGDPNIPRPSSYILTVTGGNGCITRDTVNICVLCRPSVTIETTIPDICRQTVVLTAHAEGSGPFTYLWSPGNATSPSISVSSSSATSYTVQVKNICGGTISAPVIVRPHRLVTGPFPPITCPNVFTPNGDGANDLWVVNDPSGSVPAYNATYYHLEVRDRWGTIVADLYGNTSTGFANHSIPGWNGIATHSALYSWWQHLWGKEDTYAGLPVSDGVYFYIFSLGNCDHTLTDVCVGFIHVFR